MYIHTYIHTYTYTYMCIYIYIYIHMYTHDNYICMASLSNDKIGMQSTDLTAIPRKQPAAVCGNIGLTASRRIVLKRTILFLMFLCVYVNVVG